MHAHKHLSMGICVKYRYIGVLLFGFLTLMHCRKRFQEEAYRPVSVCGDIHLLFLSLW